MRRFFAIVLAPLGNALGDNCCGKCRATSWLMPLHDTPYGMTEDSPAGANWGVSVLCQHCWEKLATPERRLPYYQRIVDTWTVNREHWPAIKTAVLAGK